MEKRVRKSKKLLSHYCISSLCSSLPSPQNDLHSSSSCHLGVGGTGGLPSSPALDPRLCYPGAQHNWQPGRQHLPPGEAGVFILAVGGERCRRAAVWQAGGSEVCAGQQTPQRQTCPGKAFLDQWIDWLAVQYNQHTESVSLLMFPLLVQTFVLLHT